MKTGKSSVHRVLRKLELIVRTSIGGDRKVKIKIKIFLKNTKKFFAQKENENENQNKNEKRK